jgi:hypothetical protein
VVVGDGSLTPALDMTVVVGMAAMALIGSSVSVSSSRPQMGAASALVVARDDIVEHEVICGHTLLRASGDVSLDEAMGTAH